MHKSTFLKARIVMLDDQPANILLLRKILFQAGYVDVTGVTDADEFFLEVSRGDPDLILLDLMMPGSDGIQVMERLKSKLRRDNFVPILMLTANVSPEAKRKALAGGVTDFLTKPFDHSEVLLRIRNLLSLREVNREQARYEEELETTVRERTAELREALSELRKTQQQVIQQERMNALAVMAGGVAHDLNNALSVILGFGELVLMDCDADPKFGRNAEALRAMVTAANDAARMVARLREFNRPPSQETWHPVDFSSLIRQAITLTEPRCRTQASAQGIKIEVRMETSKVPRVLGDAAELRECLTNLIFNAVDAMPGGGVIKLRAYESSGQVVLEVSDTGMGMNEEVRRRCLEPFFTTKGENGTGLGLAVVYGIVQRHGGSVEIESAPGHGSTFRFRFPKLPGDEAGAAIASATAGDPARILIVDQHDVLREILRALLQEDGHTVCAVKTGRQSLQELSSAKYDIVITNQLLGDMTGTQLISEIKGSSPAQPVIMLTGFAESGDAPESSGADLVVAKPASREVLRHAIASLIPSST